MGVKFAAEAIRKDPKNFYAFQTRGWALSNLQKYADAISDFTTAIQLCPQWNAVKLGQLYYQRAFSEGMRKETGDHERACEDVRQALRYDPANSKYGYFRSRFCRE